ncbi:M23 family metallopeptidase [Sphingomonas mollis]|uniref:M23 family metallopeptidase n=1 Tax=Sphingomonas mollis TaxID=2795726 RepID=A0ABS0XS56_9SPHN|nr:M23 family metallopeptidase [Sphingomonas sp. BT553]MBJ6122890.1 M23 family metallopeptidase [Sphingomonas sp. BT553]
MRRIAAIGGVAVLAGCVAPSGPPPVAAPPVVAVPSPPVPVVPAVFRMTGVPMQGGLVRGQAPNGAVSVMLDDKPVAVAGDGRFILGFDRDAPGTARLVAMLGDGRQVTQALTVAPREWRIERVDAPYRAGKSDAEFDAARPAELAQIVAARARVTDAAGWRQPMRWPASGRQSGWFGAQRVYQGKPGSYHGGADVAVPTGTPVMAPADGVVILAADRPFTLEGNLLMIDHGMGLNSAMLHLSRIDVRVGDHVRQGQPVGLSGATGRATGPHLHWGLQWRGAKLDPLLVVGVGPAG